MKAVSRIFKHWTTLLSWITRPRLSFGCTCINASTCLFMATTGDVWIIQSFQIWGHVLHVEHMACVITNCGQHQWVILFPLSIALWSLQEENTTGNLLSPSLDLFFKILLFQITFLIFFSFLIFSLYFHQAELLLQCVSLFHSRELSKC